MHRSTSECSDIDNNVFPCHEVLIYVIALAEPTCEVMAIAVDHRTIICVVGCNGTQSASLNISTTLPSPTEEQCDSRISGQNTAEGKLIY